MGISSAPGLTLSVASPPHPPLWPSHPSNGASRSPDGGMLIEGQDGLDGGMLNGDGARSKLPWHVSGRLFVTRWLWLLGCRLAQAGTCKACHASKASTVGSGCPPIPGPGVNQNPAPISPISIAIPARTHWPFHSQHLRQSSLALLALNPLQAPPLVSRVSRDQLRCLHVFSHVSTAARR